ncbi:MAG: stage 0 sporulation family protein [Deltaproteobacteria bacterium]|nr:stage 0 sporulation family protein [Deltaproteobacteria bacterium]
MTRVVGVSFKDQGKVYSFDAGDHVIRKNDKVIVDTENGMAFGTAMTEVRLILRDRLPGNLKPVIRPATKKDFERDDRNKELEKEAVSFCSQKIRELNLLMKLVSVDCLFDKSKIIFYFTADKRVDFRELVKELVQQYKTRIELRQIWVRSEARIFGGIGVCGRELCCNSFLKNFSPVSIKMVKEQNMLLNPEKISGICGRLMCCLSFEYDTYAEAKRHMPKLGKSVTIAQGKGKVVRQNIFDEKVVVDLGEGNEVEVSVDEILS